MTESNSSSADTGLSTWINIKSWPSYAKGAAGSAIVILILASAIPGVLGDNTAAQVLFSILLALVTTLISVFATVRYAKRQSQDELTRYGLQAFRNLENLAVKVSIAQQTAGPDEAMLTSMQLDIDQAKRAWQDLLREVFLLQDRLQRESLEIAQEYKTRIANTSSLEEKSQLRREQDTKLAQIAAKTPLAVTVDETVACRSCGKPVVASLGTSGGHSARPVCGNCDQRFFIHRQADGSIAYGGDHLGDPREPRERVILACPSDDCESTEEEFEASPTKSVAFLQSCKKCGTHIQFTGTAQNPVVADLGHANASFECPYCDETNATWVDPGAKREFIDRCSACSRTVQLRGTNVDLEVHKVDGILYGNHSNPRVLAASAANQLAAGHLTRARELYRGAGERGLDAKLLEFDIAIIDFAEKRYSNCRTALEKLGRNYLGSLMRIRVEFLSALVNVAEGNEPDLDKLVEVLKTRPEFKLYDTSVLKFLRTFLERSGPLDNAIQLVYDTVDGNPIDPRARNDAHDSVPEDATGDKNSPKG